MKLDFNDRELYWICIDIANQFGNDKMSFEDRCNWVQENELQLESLEAESPWEYRNAVNALRDKLAGRQVSHMVYLDASNQALQLYAILTGDKQTAMTCNLANETIMADAYQMLADKMNEIAPFLKLTRTNCKKALMTTMYGKSDGSLEIVNNIVKGNMTQLKKAEKYASFYNFTIEISATGKPKVVELYNIFKTALTSIAPKAVITMEALTEINSSLVLPVYRWTLPDNFNVRYDVKKDIPIELESVYSKKGFEITLPLMEITVYEADDTSAGMSPNVIHSVDGYVVRQMIRKMGHKFITTIHDAFASHPKDCDLMVQNYKDILIELLNSNLLSDIMTEISGTPMFINKTGDLTCEDIQDSLYLLA